MIKTILLLSTLLSVSVHASDLHGKWVGKGLWNMGSVLKHYETQVSLDVKISDTQVVLKDCWQPVPYGTNGKSICYDTTYDLKEGRIYFEGNWIGYLEPSQMLAFYGNSQVSEQIIIHYVAKDKIQFVYSYANFDGDTHYRVHDLTRVNPSM